MRREKKEQRKKEKKMCKFSSFNLKALTGAFFIRGGILYPSEGQFAVVGVFTEMRLEI